jgi:glyoxylase-like metal-dependent hydrolase (beta-lactamase superfamily II)
MAEVKILIQGYAREEGGVELASSTATLIKDNGVRVIVDPGMNRAALLESLTKEGLKLEDINFIVLTHTHLDHCLLAGIFENAKILDNSDIFC